MTLTLKYAFFAVLATVTNIATQHVVFIIHDKEFTLYIAMALGTITGLVVKYVLDKKYIFYFETHDFREDSRKFIFYSLMGVITTLLFWGTELLFNFCIAGQAAKYIGAAVGLTIGYVTKYQLDKRFVFKRPESTNDVSLFHSPCRYINDLNTYRSAIIAVTYMIVVLICLRYARDIMNGGCAWNTADWLINYEGGLVRRGLIGQVLFELSSIGLNLLWTTFFLQSLIYFLLVYYTLKIFFSVRRPASWLMLIFSPAFIFMFPFYDMVGGLRKEILVFLSFYLLSYGLLHKKMSHFHTSASLLIYGLSVFSHELAAFCLPFFVYLLLSEKMDKGKRLAVNLYTAAYIVLAVGGIIIALKFPGNVDVKNRICNSLASAGLQETICKGAIQWLALDLNDSVRKMNNYFFKYLTIYPVLLILAAIPILLTDWWKKNIAILATGFIFLVPLFMVAMDWGRWIHIYTVMVSIVLLFQSVQSPIAMRKVPLSIIVAYISIWSLPHCRPTRFDFGMIDLVYRIWQKLIA